MTRAVTLNPLETDDRNSVPPGLPCQARLCKFFHFPHDPYAPWFPLHQLKGFRGGE
jgi:hypothetical protein